MVFAVFKVFISASVIAFASWLSARRPDLAGFFIALPLLSILVLPISMLEHQNVEATTTFAKSIFIGVPVSLLFFVPFLFADKLGTNFWALYIGGLVLLGGGFFVHQKIMSVI